MPGWLVGAGAGSGPKLRATLVGFSFSASTWLGSWHWCWAKAARHPGWLFPLCTHLVWEGGAPKRCWCRPVLCCNTATSSNQLMCAVPHTMAGHPPPHWCPQHHATTWMSSLATPPMTSLVGGSIQTTYKVGVSKNRTILGRPQKKKHNRNCKSTTRRTWSVPGGKRAPSLTKESVLTRPTLRHSS